MLVGAADGPQYKVHPEAYGVKANMKYSTVQLAGSLLLGSAVILTCAPAHAGWGLLGGSGGGSSGGSSGFDGAYYGGSSGGSSGYAAYASYGSSGHAGGRQGFLSRLGNRLHSGLHHGHGRHARRAAYGSSGYTGFGSSGGYAYQAAYGSSGGYGVSYGSMGMGYGSTGMGYGSTGMGYGSTGMGYGSTGVGMGGGVYHGVSRDSVVAPSTTASLVSNLASDEDSVYLTVTVPGNAKVFVNDNATTSTGTVRQFVSHGLKSGKTYRFEVRAEVIDAQGEVLTERRTVSVTAGQREQLSFAFSDVDSTLDTSITLHVPEDAKVTLAGKSTRATGTERTFSTQHLKPGQIWDDYEVEVQVGEQVKRQTVRLLAGDSLQLSFNFEDEPGTDLIASR
jgi:uncharacterized protein (TIGR03000 family)